MAIIGHVATCLGLFPYDGMTVTDMIHRAEEAMCRVITVGNGNCSQADTSVPKPQVVWVGTQADACFFGHNGRRCSTLNWSAMWMPS